MMIATLPVEIKKMSVIDLSDYISDMAWQEKLSREEFKAIMAELKLRGEHPEVLAGLAGHVPANWR